jgi:flavin-dependent dehydrogenase
MEEALIIGGGPAGASLAVRLARAGRPVLLIEREAGPHDKVCGEFLSFEAAGYLAELGLDATALGAVPITGVDLLHRDRMAGSDLPFQALSLSRRVMDEALLARAADVGAQVRRGRRVTRLERLARGWRAHLNGGEVVEAADAFLATGKHDLRGWARPAGRQADLIGFKQHWTLSPEQAGRALGRVELHLFPGGYAGLEPVEGGRANLCLVVRKRAFHVAGRSWPALLDSLRTSCPSLGERLNGARPSSDKALAIAAIPYGYVRARGDGLWRLGDQAAVIPSLAGEGMSIALHSARLAAEVMLAGGTPQTYQTALAHDVGRQVARATWLSRALVRGWTQALTIGMARAHPKALSLAAAATRIPRRALSALSAEGDTGSVSQHPGRSVC